MTRFTLEISDELNTWLTEQARLNHRSKNGQIEWLLTEAMPKPFAFPHYSKPFDGCKALKEAANLESTCCTSCHDEGRADTNLTEVKYLDKIYLVCCHTQRAFEGITFKEQLERNKG